MWHDLICNDGRNVYYPFVDVRPCSACAEARRFESCIDHVVSQT
eukprot:SAG31_NODE_871_length_11335_cov_4.910822_2_plen_44_part_00